MRIIKFRGKRVDNGEWVEGYYRMKFWMCGEGVEEAAMIQFLDGSREYEVHPETVGQFTGLTDNDGVKIWEGDVVKIDDNHPLEYAVGSASSDNISHHKVYWDNERAMFWDTRLEDGDSLAGYCDGDITFLVEGKVIGNIHDNPELLKGGKQ